MTRFLEMKKPGRPFVPLLFLLVTLIIHSSIMMTVPSDPDGPFMKYLSGAGKYLDGGLAPERISDFSPLYLGFHVLMRKLFNNPVPAVTGVNIFLISASSMLLFMILRLFFSPLISAAGYLAFIFSPDILIYEKVMEPEPFQIFFILGMLFFLARGHAFLSGLFFGLTLLTRSNLFPLVLLIPAWMYFSMNKGPDGRMGCLRSAGLFAAAPAVAMLVIVMMNYVNTGAFSYYYQNPGYILFEGNNPNSRGQSAIYPPLVDEMAYEYPGEPDIHHQIYREFAGRVSGKEINITRVNSFWSAKALNFIIDHPAHFIMNAVIKLHYFFHEYRRHDVSGAWKYDRKLTGSGIPFFPFWILSSLGIAGLILSLRRIGDLFPFYSVILIYTAVLTAGYTSSRQRVAVLAVLIFFACATAEILTRNRVRILVLLLVPLLAVPLLLWKNDLMHEEDFLWDAYGESRRLWNDSRKARDEMDFEKAKKYAALSVVHTPWMEEDRQPSGVDFGAAGVSGHALNEWNFPPGSSPSWRFNRAILLLNAGKLDESESTFRELIREGRRFKRDFDHASGPEYYLGLIHVFRGDNEGAGALFTEDLRKHPGSPFSLSYLFALTGEGGFEEKLNRYFDRIDASWFIGRAFLNMKMYHHAVRYLSYVHEKLPEFRKGMICYSAALAGAGDDIRAYSLYVEASRKRREPVMFREQVIGIFRKRLEKEPLNGAAHFYMGLVYEQFGRFAEALGYLQTARTLSGDEDIIQGKIREVDEKLRSVREQ